MTHAKALPTPSSGANSNEVYGQDWNAAHIVAGLANLIQKQTVTGSAVQSLALTGLNLIPGKLYQLAVMLLSNQAVQYTWKINGDSTTNHYAAHGYYSLYGDTAMHQVDISDNKFNDSNNAAKFLFETLALVIDPQGVVWAWGIEGGYTSVLERGSNSYWYGPPTPVTSVTSIEFDSNVSASIAVGSWVALYGTE